MEIFSEKKYTIELSDTEAGALVNEISRLYELVTADKLTKGCDISNFRHIIRMKDYLVLAGLEDPLM